MWETQVLSLGGEDPLETEIATHSSILAWEIPWMEKPGGLHTVHRISKRLAKKKKKHPVAEFREKKSGKFWFSLKNAIMHDFYKTVGKY